MHAGTALPMSPQVAVPIVTQGSASGVGRGKRKASSSGGGASPPKSRKERACNWTLLEILDMVAAKRHEFLEDIEVEDARELMHPELTKWGKIAIKVNEAGKVRGGHIARDGLAYKYKWQTLLADYKKVAPPPNSLRRSTCKCTTGSNTSQVCTLPIPVTS
jgi:hypothetical protein